MKKSINVFIKTILFLMIALFLNSSSVFATPTVDFNLGEVGDLHVQTTGEEQYISIQEVSTIQNGTNKGQSTAEAFNVILRRYRGVIIGISGLLTLTFVLIFIITNIKLTASAMNPQKRAEISKSLIWIILGAAGFGSVTVLLSFGLGLFK